MENIEMKIDSLGSIFDRFYFGKIDGLHTGKQPLRYIFLHNIKAWQQTTVPTGFTVQLLIW